MRSCIYCLESKPESAFNREHVIPEAFGVFANNLVLDCVCEDCNTYFGKHLDLVVARDSIESLDRVRVGLKKPSEYKTLGRRGRTHSRFESGPLKGAFAHHVPDPSGDGLAVAPSPQIGIKRSEDAEFVWYRLMTYRDRTIHVGGHAEQGASFRFKG